MSRNNLHNFGNCIPKNYCLSQGWGFSEKQIEWLKKNAPKNNIEQLTEKFNKRFHTHLETKQIYKGCNSRRIKMGVVRKQLPIGSEIVENGFVFQKVSLANGTKRQKWKHKHILIWEAANGKLPEGHILLFADNNKLNVALENLILVPRGVQAYINKMGFAWDSCETLKTILLIAKHRTLICKKFKELGFKSNFNKLSIDDILEANT